MKLFYSCILLLIVCAVLAVFSIYFSKMSLNDKFFNCAGIMFFLGISSFLIFTFGIGGLKLLKLLRLVLIVSFLGCYVFGMLSNYFSNVSLSDHLAGCVFTTLLVGIFFILTNMCVSASIISKSLENAKRNDK